MFTHSKHGMYNFLLLVVTNSRLYSHHLSIFPLVRKRKKGAGVSKYPLILINWISCEVPTGPILVRLQAWCIILPN